MERTSGRRSRTDQALDLAAKARCDARNGVLALSLASRLEAVLAPHPEKQEREGVCVCQDVVHF